MSTSLTNSTIFEANPYEGHPNLTELEAEVLWQYAKLAQNVKEVRVPRHVRKFRLSHQIIAHCRDTPSERGTRRDSVEASSDARDENGACPYFGMSSRVSPENFALIRPLLRQHSSRHQYGR